jgi:transcriptional regulator with PAS, ATPase and Fis domain
MTKHAPFSSSDFLLTDSLKLTTAMAGEENTIVLLRNGLQLCTRVLACERGMILQRSDSQVRVAEYAGDRAAQSIPFSSTALELVDKKKEPLLISDTVGDDVLGNQESINRNDIRSILCARLELAEEGEGNTDFFLYCDGTVARRPFTPADLERFGIMVRLMTMLVNRARRMERQEATIEELRALVSERDSEELIFGSDAFGNCLKLIGQGAATDVPVILIGETGTGKESLARLVHKQSRRRDKPFLAVNCGAIPGNLIESELFGHEKGAFTGAVSQKRGYFEEADGGTLFLDEIGELPPEVQSHFLRVLQEGEIVRVGATRPIGVDVRIVSATHVELEQAVHEQRFRQDLFYRLNVLPVHVPPVRDRGEDALLLARFFLKRYAESFGSSVKGFTREAEKTILVYDWPGNVRDIQNRIQRAVITSSGNLITPEDLGLDSAGKIQDKTLREARETVDREMIGRALERSPGNLTNAAKILDIDRKSLRLLLEKYNIVP